MKELKIRFYEDDKGWCREQWEIFPEKGKPRRFLVRLTGGPGGRWLTGEGADSEPGFDIAREVTLILCDQNWNEKLRTGNDRTRFPEPFPTLAEHCIEAWNAVVKTEPIIDLPDFWRWFEPYLPADLPSWEQINWRNLNRETINRETLARFDFCGEPLAVVRLAERHTRCDLTWRKYFVGTPEPMEDGESYVHFFGYGVDRVTDHASVPEKV